MNYDSVFCDLSGCRLVLVTAASGSATSMQLTLTAEDLNTLAVFGTTFNDVPFGGDTVSPGSSDNIITMAAGTQGDIAFSRELSTSMVGDVWNSRVTSALTVTYQLTAALSGMNFVGTAKRGFPRRERHRGNHRRVTHEPSTLYADPANKTGGVNGLVTIAVKPVNQEAQSAVIGQFWPMVGPDTGSGQR